LVNIEEVTLVYTLTSSLLTSFRRGKNLDCLCSTEVSFIHSNESLNKTREREVSFSLMRWMVYMREILNFPGGKLTRQPKNSSLTTQKIPFASFFFTLHYKYRVSMVYMSGLYVCIGISNFS